MQLGVVIPSLERESMEILGEPQGYGSEESEGSMTESEELLTIGGDQLN